MLPVKVMNSALINTTTTPETASETKYITAVPINFMDIGLPKPGGVVICDTPGFDDTSGAEVDVANGVVLVKSIQTCASVKLVFLINKLDVGGRWDGIKHLAYTIVRLIPDIKDYLGSFSYLFTKFEKGKEEKSIHAQLKDIIVKMDPLQASDEAFITLLGNMVEQTQEGAKIIDPITDKPNEILSILTNATAIHNPRSVFRFFTTPQSNDAIRNQIHLQQLAIISAISRMDHNFIKYKLDELKYLQEILKQENIQNCYDECVRKASQCINDRYQEVLSLFNGCLTNQNKLTNGDIDRYKNCIKYLRSVEDLRKSHLEELSVPNYEKLIQNLKIQVDEIVKQLYATENLNTFFVNNWLINIKYLAEHFPEEIAVKYEEVREYFSKKLASIQEEVQQAIILNDFEQVAEGLTKIKQASFILQGYISQEKIEQISKNLIECLVAYLKKIAESVNYLFHKDSLAYQDIESLQTCVSILDLAINTITLQQHLNVDQIKILHSMLFEKIVKYLEGFNQKINDLFVMNDKEQAFKDMELLITQMESLYKIPGVTLVSNAYSTTVSSIVEHIRALTVKAENELRGFQGPTSHINFNRFAVYLSSLKSIEWVNRIRPGTCQDILKSIKEQSIEYAAQMHEQMTEIDLDLLRYDNIEKAYQLVVRVKAMEPIVKFFPELEEYKKSTCEKFNMAIEQTFKWVKEEFDLEKRGLYHQRQNLQQLKNIKERYDELSLARLYLKEKEYDNIEIVNEEENKVKQKQDSLINELKANNDQITQSLDKLKNLSERYLALQSRQHKQGNKVLAMFREGATVSEGEKLLRDNSFQDISELIMDIKGKEEHLKQINKQYTVQINQLDVELNSLEVIKKEYEILLTSKQISIRAQEFLKENKFQSIESLDKEIASREQEIIEAEKRSDGFVFERLDDVNVQRALDYLEICKKIRSKKDDANITYSALQNYLMRYGQFIQIEMGHFFSEIITFDGKTDSTMVFQNARKFANRLKELADLSRKSQTVREESLGNAPRMFELISGSNILTEWTKQLSLNHDDMRKEQAEVISKQGMALDAKAVITRALSQVDWFMEDLQKYSSLCNSYEQNRLVIVKEIYKSAEESIERRDFHGAYNSLSRLDERPANGVALAKIKYQFSTAIAEIAKEVDKEVIMIVGDMRIETVNSIKLKLDKLKEAKKYFDPKRLNIDVLEHSSKFIFLEKELEVQIDECIKRVETCLSKKIIKFLDKIVALINVNEFYEVEEKKEQITAIIQLLTEYGLDDVVTDRMAKLEENLEAVADRVVEQYIKGCDIKLIDRTEVVGHFDQMIREGKEIVILKESNNEFKVYFKKEENEEIDNFCIPNLSLSLQEVYEASTSDDVSVSEEIFRVPSTFDGKILEKTKKSNKFYEYIYSEVRAKQGHTHNCKNIKDYVFKPPKDVIAKLEKVAKHNDKYRQSLAKIRESIKTNFRMMFQKVKDAKFDTRQEYIQTMESILWTLPEDLFKPLETELKALKDSIAQQEAYMQSELNSLIVGEADSIAVIERLKELMEKYTKENRYVLISSLKEHVLKRVQLIKQRINQTLSTGNILAALNETKNLFHYKRLDSSFREISILYEEIIGSLTRIFEKSQDSIIKIATIDIETLESSFSIFMSFMNFKNEYESGSKELLNERIYKSTEVYAKITEFFDKIYSIYREAINSMNISALNEVLNIMKLYDKFLSTIKHYSEEDGDSSKVALAKISENGRFYSDMVVEISRKLQTLSQEILANDLLRKSQEIQLEERKEFYEKLAIDFKIIHQTYELRDHLDGKIVIIADIKQDCVTSLISQIQSLESQIFTTLGSSTFIEIDRDNDGLALYYACLFLLKTHLCGIDIKINEAIDKAIAETIRKMDEKIQSLKGMLDLSDTKQVAKVLINLKHVSLNIPHFKKTVDIAIDNILQLYKQQNKQLTNLRIELQEHPNGIGGKIVADYKCFEGERIHIWTVKAQGHGVEHVLDHLTGDDINKDDLRYFYDKFNDLYWTAFKSCQVELEDPRVKAASVESKLVSKITMLVRPCLDSIKTTISNGYSIWDYKVRNIIPELIANIFTLWTIKNMEHFNEMKNIAAKEEDRKTYLMQPHAAQVIAIFRMLGLGYEEKKTRTKRPQQFFDHVAKVWREITVGTTEIEEFSQSVYGPMNNLVQIGTGEGKSVTLAVTAATLGLFGIDVNCASYSEYLSDRDYQSFLPIFNALGISEYIHYNTFNKLCERVINENGDVRKLVTDLICAANSNSEKKELIVRPKILLIDEVDVFFDKNFYGNCYNPMTIIQDPTITALINLIWEKRESVLTIRSIERTSQYQECCRRFNRWELLVKEAVKDMLYDLKNFLNDIKNFQEHEDHKSYIISDDKMKIGYKEQDGSISYSQVHGYKTLFAYYHEREQGRIVAYDNIEKNTGLLINCGSFSYAEVAKEFNFIMGVTGTLSTLSEPEKRIVKKEFGIKKSTYMPSVFGKNKCTFREEADTHIVNKADYFMRICEHITKQLEPAKGKKRAILVFFESKKLLKDFYNSSYLASIKHLVSYITEETLLDDRANLIQKATMPGRVTLLTREYGRGVDFICHSQLVLSSGGIHVIQTFLSESLSEQTQIMGRTARQGADGSYSMILLNQNLEKFLGTTFEADIKLMYDTACVYKTLDVKRNESFADTYSTIGEDIKKCKLAHNEAKEFINTLCNYTGNSEDLKFIRDFLSKINFSSAEEGVVNSRTICLMDATYSMGNLLLKAKTTVAEMFELASKFLENNGIPASLQMQFAVYRNYSNNEEELLQVSDWETKAENLRTFMNKISVSGGLGNEAIEIGLWHAVQESEKPEGISQVILIGDMPANTEKEILHNRNSFHGGETYWKTTKFNTMTHYTKEVQKLQDKEIPVHAFFVSSYAESNFREIAKRTGGSCSPLDVNSTNGSKLLVDAVTTEIIKNVGNNTKPGQGEVLAKEFRRLRGYVT